MATSKGVIQGYAAQAAVDSSHQIIIAADVIGSGSEQAMLIPMIEQHLKDHDIPALIADNQMRKRDERFAEQGKYKGKPDPLSDKVPTGQPKAVKRFSPADFTFNDCQTCALSGACLRGPLKPNDGRSRQVTRFEAKAIDPAQSPRSYQGQHAVASVLHGAQH